MPAFTICGDYTNKTFVMEYYKRMKNTTAIDYNSKAYKDYFNYITRIGSLNAENIHLIDDIENSRVSVFRLGSFNCDRNVIFFQIL